MNDASEKPKINDFAKRRKILNKIPMPVIPNMKITKTYIKLVEILFLKAVILLIEAVFMLSINILILSITKVLSLKPMILANTAPRITPRKRRKITK